MPNKIASLLSREAEFMAAYLAKHQSSCSWDFDADQVFAAEFATQDEQDLIHDVLRCSAPFSHIIAAWEAGWKASVTERRLKALRELVKNGLAEAVWTGLGAGSKNSFGRARIRTYWHVQQLA